MFSKHCCIHGIATLLAEAHYRLARKSGPSMVNRLNFSSRQQGANMFFDEA